MLTYNENRKLYQKIVEKLVDEGLVDSEKFSKKEAISDELLAKIKEIELSDCFYLNGIEKLVNLESFTYKGMSTFKLNIIINDDGRPIEDEDGRFACSEKWIEDKIDDYYKTILNDITPIYKCKNLKKLVLPNQIRIKSIDLSNFPLLEQLNLSGCQNLESISGFDEVLKGKDFSKLNINLRDCQSLREIKNFDKVTEILSEKGQYPKQIIKLPIRSYCYLVSNANFESEEKKEKIKQNLINSDAFLWCENGLKGEKLALKSAGMKLLMQRVDDILAGICCENFSDIQNMKNIYSWVTTNTKYDKELEQKEENALAGGEKINVSHLIRTSYGTLFRGKGVCVGISNLCALMFAEQGFITKTVMCEAGGSVENSYVKYVPNHQICYIENIENQQYFFDPTWDTAEGGALRKENKDKILYFLMNKEETVKRRSFLRENGLIDAPNLFIDANKLPTLESCEDWIKTKNYLKQTSLDEYNELIENFKESDLCEKYLDEEENISLKNKVLFAGKEAVIRARRYGKEKLKHILGRFKNNKDFEGEEPEYVDESLESGEVEMPEYVEGASYDFSPKPENKREM